MGPAEVESWLLGLGSLLPREAIAALVNQVRLQQMDGCSFDTMVASRQTPQLGDALRPSHMATLRRCWNTTAPSFKKSAPANNKVHSSPHSSSAPSLQTMGQSHNVRRPPSDDASTQAWQFQREHATTCQKLQGFGDGRDIQSDLQGSEVLESMDPGLKQQFKPPPRSRTDAKLSPSAAERCSTPQRPTAPLREDDSPPLIRPSPAKSFRPAQVPPLDLTFIHRNAGNRGEAAPLNNHQWKRPQHRVQASSSTSTATPAVQGFASASVEDQQRIAEFFGYRDEGFIATMHGLKTDMIRPHLYLGTMADAAYWPLLKSLGVTHILNCAVEAQKVSQAYENHGIQYCLLPYHDSAEQAHSLVRQKFRTLRQATKFIHASRKSRSQRGCVMVHCVQGLQRGAAIVCAYLMEYEGMSFDQAFTEMTTKHQGCLTSQHWQSLLYKFSSDLLRGY